MEIKFWKTNKMNVEVIGKTEDDRFTIIKLLEPIYTSIDKKTIAYNIGTEITVTNNELVSL